MFIMMGCHETKHSNFESSGLVHVFPQISILEGNLYTSSDSFLARFLGGSLVDGRKALSGHR